MHTVKVGIICNYYLQPDRIGGMDRFFVAFDAFCKEKQYSIDWFFAGCPIPFYESLNIISEENKNVEHIFLEYCKTSNKKYDVVFTHFLPLCTPFFKKAGAFVNAIIAVDHNPRPLKGFPLKKKIKNLIKGILFARYITRFVGVSSYTCESIAQDYGRACAKKTVRIYNGVDTSLYVRKKEKNNPKKFIVVSHLRPSKGIKDLIEAAHKLPLSLREKLKVDIYGEGPQEEELKALTDQYQLKNLHFKGSNPHLPEIIGMYDYMLQPTYMECFSLSILESLAANVPVITTTVGGNPEIIVNEKNGFLFSPGDIDAFQNVLHEILDGTKNIENDVFPEIEEHYHLNRMVHEYGKLLEACI